MLTEFPAEPQRQTPIWKIEWSDALSVGIPEIDADHKRFARLVNELNRSIIDRAPVTEIRRRLELIIDDAGQHFANEERLFKEWKYPGSESHAAIHTQIINELHGIMRSLVCPSPDAQWINSGLEIKAVLINHILKDDMKYDNSYRNHQGQS
jgi:hemerythrin-like metal-binding protein